MSEIRIATRREFLSKGLGIIGVSATLPNFLVNTAMSAPEPARVGERILVVLQLSGGHDAMSAVVPYRNDHYIQYRQNTRIQANEVLKVNDDFGLHPNLKGCRELVDQGKFAAVVGASYPNPNRSHFTSMDIWHIADNTRRQRYGWLGRYADAAFKGQRNPLVTLSVGGDRNPKALQGRENPGLSLGRSQDYRSVAGGSVADLLRQINQESSQGGNNASLQFVARTAVDANASSEAIQRAAQQSSSRGGNYPTTNLGNSFQTVANLIAGNLSTRVYYVYQGGYDTHGQQRQRHNQLMTELNNALCAFQRDIEERGFGDRVLVMAFSEFGRTVRENRSSGTDHGTAGTMFLMGRGVKAGVHGSLPNLAPEALVNREPVPTVDFRGVYAAILDKWLRTPSMPVLGQQYPHIDCIQG